MKNLPGSRALEVLAEGEKAHLEELLKYLHSGPPLSRVERVDVEWSEYSGDFRHFQVSH